jgi:hypothetical protein
MKALVVTFTLAFAVIGAAVAVSAISSTRRRGLRHHFRLLNREPPMEKVFIACALAFAVIGVTAAVTGVTANSGYADGEDRSGGK